MKILRDDELGWKNSCVYWSDKYLGFNFPLHRGWQSYPRWMKGGWEYYEAAILYGNKTTQQSKWLKLPKLIIPAKLVHTARLRKRAYREAWKNDKPIAKD